MTPPMLPHLSLSPSQVPSVNTRSVSNDTELIFKVSRNSLGHKFNCSKLIGREVDASLFPHGCRHTLILFIMRSHYLLQPCCMALCHFAMFFGVLVAVLCVFGCCFVLFSLCFLFWSGFLFHFACVLVLFQQLLWSITQQDGQIPMS